MKKSPPVIVVSMSGKGNHPTNIIIEEILEKLLAKFVNWGILTNESHEIALHVLKVSILNKHPFFHKLFYLELYRNPDYLKYNGGIDFCEACQKFDLLTNENDAKCPLGIKLIHAQMVNQAIDKNTAGVDIEDKKYLEILIDTLNSFSSKDGDFVEPVLYS